MEKMFAKTVLRNTSPLVLINDNRCGDAQLDRDAIYQPFCADVRRPSGGAPPTKVNDLLPSVS